MVHDFDITAVPYNNNNDVLIWYTKFPTCCFHSSDDAKSQSFLLITFFFSISLLIDVGPNNLGAEKR